MALFLIVGEWARFVFFLAGVECFISAFRIYRQKRTLDPRDAFLRFEGVTRFRHVGIFTAIYVVAMLLSRAGWCPAFYQACLWIARDPVVEPLGLLDLPRYALIGMGLETVAVAVMDRTPTGYSSPWFLPAYALPPVWFGYMYHGQLDTLPFWLRGLINMVAMMAMEAAWMALLGRVNGSPPGRYLEIGDSWGGLVRPKLAPAWFLAGLILEFLYFTQHGHLPPYKF